MDFVKRNKFTRPFLQEIFFKKRNFSKLKSDRFARLISILQVIFTFVQGEFFARGFDYSHS